jgi:hypothetical protein
MNVQTLRRWLQALSLLLALGGLTYAGFGLRQLAFAHQASRWPAVAGTVTRSTVRDTGRRTYARHGPEVELYARDLAYTYRVGGETYEGHAIGPFDAPAVDYGTAHGDAERFPAGGTVQVYHDPAHPERSCLDPNGSDTRSWIEVGSGLFFLVLAAVLWQTARWRRPAPQA